MHALVFIIIIICYNNYASSYCIHALYSSDDMTDHKVFSDRFSDVQSLAFVRRQSTFR